MSPPTEVIATSDLKDSFEDSTKIDLSEELCVKDESNLDENISIDEIELNNSISPGDVGLSTHPKGALAGGDAASNAAALVALLEGATGAYRDAVLMNAGAGLVVSGLAATLSDGVAMAADAISSGRARDALRRLVALSNEA